ncbi:MAG: 16S rRNA (cytosine(1402)-N(4))-methyltransferase RsmH [Acidimicrobiia bacterium]
MNQDGPRRDGQYHLPVLVEEVARLFAPTMPGVVIDATFGGGGHSRYLLDEFGDDVTIVGIDRDPEAVANAAALGITAIRANFTDLSEIVTSTLDEAPVGVLFDFGVSSRQLDEPSRGFSYRHDGPLDMRMGPDASVSADIVVNQWSEADLSRLIREYGEEPMARRIARAIVSARPIKSTAQLSTVITDATPAARRRAGHPARRTFQAIRIAVNGELRAVEQGIDQAITVLADAGRVVAISYHSLEDRIVKQRFAAGATGCICPPDLPICGCGVTAELRILTRKPLRASEAEVEANRRARSAVLRGAEKVAA